MYSSSQLESSNAEHAMQGHCWRTLGVHARRFEHAQETVTLGKGNGRRVDLGRVEKNGFALGMMRERKEHVFRVRLMIRKKRPDLVTRAAGAQHAVRNQLARVLHAQRD